MQCNENAIAWSSWSSSIAVRKTSSSLFPEPNVLDQMADGSGRLCMRSQFRIHKSDCCLCHFDFDDLITVSRQLTSASARGRR